MPYAERTKVPFDQSIREIVSAVRKAGADQIGQFEGHRDFAIQFTLESRMIRFRIPLLEQRTKAATEQHRRQRARALKLVVKAKLESVESGIETIEQAFLANVVTGDGSTVYERVHRDLQIEYDTGEPPSHGLLAPPKGS